jgi:periplasmic protein TonB
VEIGQERMLFPWMLGASMLVHAVVVFWCLSAQFEPPQVISPQQGKTSILLRASAAARPKPAEEILQKSPIDLPPMPEVANPQYQVPKAATSQIESIVRPEETAQAKLPDLKTESALHAPPRPPELAPPTEQVAKTADMPAVAETAPKLEAALARPKVPSDATPVMHIDNNALPPIDIPTLDPSSKPALPEAAYAKIPIPKPTREFADSVARPKQPLQAKAPSLKTDATVLTLPESLALEVATLPATNSSSTPANAEPAAPKKVDLVDRPRHPLQAKTPEMKADPAMVAMPEPLSLEAVKVPAAKTPIEEVKPAPARRPETVLERPKTTKDNQPLMRADNSAATVAELPPLQPSPTKTETAKAAEVPPVQTTKDGPQSLPRPVAKELVPKLEAITKVAELVSIASEASDPSQGVADELPQKLNINPPPPYPPEAIVAGQQGMVQLRTKIDAAGKITAISVYSSSGSKLLDDAALSTVRTWVFVPARRAGRAIPYEVLVPIEFIIRRRF